MAEYNIHKKRRASLRSHFSATRLLSLGFIVMILVGTGLLTLPWAASSGKSVGFFDALFTATSAVCVTGLTVVETGTVYSLFGQTVILLLIQAGGLGFVTIMTLISVALGRRVTLRDRMLIQEAMNENNIGGMVRLILWVIKLTFACELAGAALLAVRFISEFGLARGAYYAVFHSVSAFCNAGFDILGEGTSVMRYAQDPLVSLTLCALVIAGGLGFGVINDVLHARRFSKMRLHTKLVIVTTGILLFVGMVGTLAAEWNNPETLGGMSIGGKLLAAFFQSVTLRTAGFATLAQGALRPATKFIGVALMFVGAAPASTGGGMKVTTVAILVLLTASIIRGKKDTTVFGRTLSTDVLKRAMAIFMTGLAVLILCTVLLSALHPEITFVDVLFECVSALCTVGLSAAGTVNYCAAARLALILMMYMGRIGPLTLALAVAMRQQNQSASIKLPEEKVTIG